MEHENIEQQQYDNARSNAWLISFADLLSILVTLFILLFSISANTVVSKSERVTTTKKTNIIRKNSFDKGLDLNYLSNLINSKMRLNPALVNSILMWKTDKELIFAIKENDIFVKSSAQIKQESEFIIGFLTSELARITNAIMINGIDNWNYLPTNAKIRSNLDLPLEQALIIAKKLKDKGYNYNIETYGIIGGNKKKPELARASRYIEFVIQEYKGEMQ